MRAVLAAFALGLLLVATGCGSSSAATGSAAGTDAAALVPASALAFVSADARLDSDGWRTIIKTLGPIGVDATIKNDLPAAVGDEANLAVLGVESGKPEAVAIVKSKDESKLRALAAKFDESDGSHYTVQQVDGWSVVADSAGAFQSVRSAASGSSLADDADFKSAMSKFDGGGLAYAYARGAATKYLPKQLQALGGSPKWIAARLGADSSSLRLQVQAANVKAPAAYKPSLLRDAPSGSILAVSFKNAADLLARIPSVPFLADLRGITGEGVLYVVPGGILPVVTLEVRPNDPAAAAASLRKLAAKIGNSLPLSVERRGAKVLLTTAAPGLNSGGGSLVDDQPFKDALQAADVPDEVQWLAYADVQRLTPLVQAFSSLFGVTAKQLPQLERLGTLVAFGATGPGSLNRFEARLTTK
ncbi:MAG: hypothetical protein QOK34_707 [Gaiellaceae bacterium]|jgi:hypothetical protein|nr:hypothetical protein [Gaiellaceae bacterium]